jgi:hypothetical protein
MKKLFLIGVILLVSTNSFALTATETSKENDTQITITFSKSEYDLFSLDKGDPKEWIRNAVEVNLRDHTQRIKANMTKELQPSESEFQAKVEALKQEKITEKLSLTPTE